MNKVTLSSGSKLFLREYANAHYSWIRQNEAIGRFLRNGGDKRSEEFKNMIAHIKYVASEMRRMDSELDTVLQEQGE